MLHTKGAEAASRENYDYAIALFNQILLKEPLVYDVRRSPRAAQLRKAGGGRGLFKKMWSTASSHPLVTKAQMALRKDPLEALQIAEQVLESDPQNAFAHRVVVEAATVLQMPKTAVLSLEILAGNSPKDREIAIKFAYALADSGDVYRAESFLSGLHDDFPADQDLALALKNISARKTMEKGGYEVPPLAKAHIATCCGQGGIGRARAGSAASQNRGRLRAPHSRIRSSRQNRAEQSEGASQPGRVVRAT